MRASPIVSPLHWPALVLALLLAAPDPAAAQYTEQVRQQLDRTTELVEGQGYSATHDYAFDQMGDDETERFSVSLDGDHAYKIVVACDNDCSDVDAKLLDAGGTVLDEDVLTDSMPILDVTTDRGGDYTVEVKMYECSSEPCYYGIAIYGKEEEERINRISRIASDAPSENVYARQVRQELDRAARSLQSERYRPTRDYELGTMPDDGTERFTLTLQEGTSYRLVAACDADCSDVDAKLFDENGNVIDESASSDDVETLSVSPSWTGPFTVEVKMYACSNEPCAYGIGVFGKATD